MTVLRGEECAFLTSKCSNGAHASPLCPASFPDHFQVVVMLVCMAAHAMNAPKTTGASTIYPYLIRYIVLHFPILIVFNFRVKSFRVFSVKKVANK